MAISDRDRKTLWGRCGNVCAVCRRQLVVRGQPLDRDAVVGDECHIVARSSDGARGGTLPEEQLDRYDNLILLCAADHRKVDQQPSTYSVQELHRIKREHEQWVQRTLAVAIETDQDPPGPMIVRVERVVTGRDLLAAIDGAHALSFDHPDPNSEEEAETIADISQELHDWMDLQDVVIGGERVRLAYRLTSVLKELAAHKPVMWCGKGWGSLIGGPNPVRGWIAVVVIRRD